MTTADPKQWWLLLICIKAQSKGHYSLPWKQLNMELEMRLRTDHHSKNISMVLNSKTQLVERAKQGPDTACAPTIPLKQPSPSVTPALLTCLTA